MNESEIPGSDSSSLKKLAKDIAAQLDKRPFSVVFEDYWKRCWPGKQMSREKRNSEIHRFAESAPAHKELLTRVRSFVRFVTQTGRFVTMLLRYLLM